MERREACSPCSTSTGADPTGRASVPPKTMHENWVALEAQEGKGLVHGLTPNPSDANAQALNILLNYQAASDP